MACQNQRLLIQSSLGVLSGERAAAVYILMS